MVFVLSLLLGQLFGKDADHQPTAHAAAVVKGAHLAPDGEGAALAQRGQSVQLLPGGDDMEGILRARQAAYRQREQQVLHTVIHMGERGRAGQPPPEKNFVVVGLHRSNTPNRQTNAKRLLLPSYAAEGRGMSPK